MVTITFAIGIYQIKCDTKKIILQPIRKPLDSVLKN